MKKEFPFIFHIDVMCDRCEDITNCVEVVVMEHIDLINIICEECLYKGFKKLREYKKETVEK